ncbi:Peptidase family M20/M25/M40 [Pilibacter termitis]|uniref:Peptidase family M20/M25/M40 n=1 Tax=Pilibacter termitis TaxID=263852 RepID=A0A1T4LXG4_9ENTE|nr:dipeptidase PepV [Pilibacter termitis]SJZ59144.1 Peptidase family M20/M25/M40 [Pilibacter termitis]
MSIDFKKEVESRKEALIEDLFTLLRVKSEREDELATKEAPFGPGPLAAMKKMLELAQRDGFATKNIDNYVGEFEYGTGDETLGVYAHMDVVPAGNGWESDPYNPEIRDGKIYARGASDDKGPTVACYYGLKILKELGVPLSKKIKFIIGTDEESGWADMDYYFQHAKKADFGFSPDAEFPIINGEKGNITEYLHFAGDNSGAFTLHSFKGGLRENMVPESATAIFTTNLPFSDVQADLSAFLEAHGVKGELSEEEGKISVTIIGKSAHGANPQSGVNGATYLARFLVAYAFEGAAKNFLTAAGHFAFNDHYGERLGVASEDEKMGKLTMNAGVFFFEKDSDENKIALNFRYPKGTDAKEIMAGLTKTVGNLVSEITLSEHEHTPHYVPMEDPLVSTLLEVYEDHTGEKGYEQVIGGGTFGRLMERGVAFGAMFPGDVDTMHQANEFIPVDVLLRAAAIYADALYRLAK